MFMWGNWLAGQLHSAVNISLLSWNGIRTTCHLIYHFSSKRCTTDFGFLSWNFRSRSGPRRRKCFLSQPMPPTIRSSGLIRPKIRPIYQQALSPQSGTGRNIAGQTAPHLGYWNWKGEIHPPHEGSRQTRASCGRDLEATLTPLPSLFEDVSHQRPWSFPAKLSVGVPKGGAVPGRLSK